ncbi:nucleotidyltransferase family protein [Aestuariibaculum lutulentum]|uniref:Nucleotidyltransferase family protein n=1 Tax=Aestuariibaculum lutulentum TaxID=2920935 RepID=A0ABS9RIU3_9FLAO|nr:nucleotidyltransferase family protein [Aestuariibaculum lutulentum]MCH4552876.1 nucleotidyltransferase family protein [Aestuariibaculum lutulentum]
MQNAPEIALVILAAGASKRMGNPKQLLPWGDSTLIEHSIKTALKVNGSPVFVVLGANFEILSEQIESYPIEVIYNCDWKQGLGTSISKAVKHITDSNLKFDGILFLLADQPFITTDYLKQMIAHFKPNKAQIIATSYNEGEKGVPVLFDAIYFKELEALNKDIGAKQVLSTHESKVEILFSGTKNIDLDTQTEYKAAYKAQFLK